MNEEEVILRNYLFHFLRSPDYKTDVNFYLPKFLTNDPAFAETQRTLSWEHEQYRLKIIDFAKQFHPQTATWGLNVWEEELGLPTDLNVDLELRRAKVMAKLLGASPMTVENTTKLVNLFTENGGAGIEELPEPGMIKIILPNENVHLEELRDSLDEMLPAHLVYDFQHNVVIEDDDSFEDLTDESTADDSSAFFLQANLPLVDNIHSDKEIDAPKYDGSVQVAEPYSFNDALRYDGKHTYDGINSDTVQFYKSLDWWFVPTSESNFDKTFQHNGNIKYDGQKPLEIEYADNMEELGKFELNQFIEEDLCEFKQFNGDNSFDGTVKADKTQSPDDNNGEVEIKRFRRFNGNLNYDGGDINYFNGAIKADGKFDFAGNGAKAGIEKIIDSLDGESYIARPTKDIPLSNISPELIDYVPITQEKESIKISLKTFEDAVDSVEEKFDSLEILKGVRYNGSKVYDGGNMNYFNGGIKADGVFNFAGEGNQAKIEVIHIDLDSDFSFLHKNKVNPPVYIENIDYIAPIQETAQISAQIYYDDTAEPSDVGGDLIIKRRLRFNGKSDYRGNFEYIDAAHKRFNGNLNYNGIFTTKLNGDIQFNGVEIYGGRHNIGFEEIVSNISGNLEIESQTIPIATRSRLGLVIVGNNLNVDDSGKISIPKMLPVNSGKLAQIFNSRRNYHVTI